MAENFIKHVPYETEITVTKSKKIVRYWVSDKTAKAFIKFMDSIISDEDILTAEEEIEI